MLAVFILIFITLMGSLPTQWNILFTNQRKKRLYADKIWTK